MVPRLKKDAGGSPEGYKLICHIARHTSNDWTAPRFRQLVAGLTLQMTGPHHGSGS